MYKVEHRTSSANSLRLILGLATLLLAALLVGVATTREDHGIPWTTPQPQTAPSSTTLQARVTSQDVVTRLEEILRIRESAYRSRDPDLLREIYSSDCPCLASDEKAIIELLDRHYTWNGIETSIEVRSVDKLHERLWKIVALFRSAALRIETEDGRLIREEPGGSDLVEFTLVKPKEVQQWLLGLASTVVG